MLHVEHSLPLEGRWTEPRTFLEHTEGVVMAVAPYRADQPFSGAREGPTQATGATSAVSPHGLTPRLATIRLHHIPVSEKPMVAPLDGIRVLEIANWLAAPAATALMADLGAEVIKVEPPGGDVYRGFLLRSLGYDYDFETNYAFELDNRGKKSITVALDKPGGPELVQRLAKDVDIVITNLIQERRERYRLTYDDIRAANPRVIFVSFSGYGTDGPDANRTGFDFAAFWAASGIMGMLAEPDAPPPLCRGGQGDHTTALNILSATLAALRLRDLTGEGPARRDHPPGLGHVDHLRRLPGRPRLEERRSPHQPHRAYQPHLEQLPVLRRRLAPARHARAVPQLLAPLLPDGEPPRLGRRVHRPRRPPGENRRADVLHRAHLRRARPRLLVREDGRVRPHLGSRGEAFRGHQQPPGPAHGLVRKIDHPEFGRFETVDTPFKIYGSDIGARGPAPTPGQHTFDLLAEFGIEGEEVTDLATAGVFG